MEIINNDGTRGLGDALHDALGPHAQLSVIASCFSIFAYGKLRDDLEQLDAFRFIFDEPTFLKRMNQAKESREFMLSRKAREAAVGGSGLELTLRNNLTQRALAAEAGAWIRSHARFKSIRSAGQLRTGSIFHVENPAGEPYCFFGPGANFDLEGLGYEWRPDVFTMITGLEGEAQTRQYLGLFESFWNDPDKLEDVTGQVLEQVTTLYRENSPEFIYFLTLYHLFRDTLEGDDSDVRHTAEIQDSVVWNKLYDFQKDAVVGAIRKLERYNGCIIADSVGLGKTFEALAVIKYYQERNERVLVLAPKRLRENWTVYLGNDERNVLVDDRFSYDVLNHTDLSRKRGMSGDMNLETLRWDNYGLVVIDESHNFRNRPTDADSEDSRYYRLLNEVIKKGRRTRVLMLSATPVNNRLLDLRNQVDIITEDHDDYLKGEGIASINQVTRTAQQRFTEWSKLPEQERTTQSFVQSLNPEYFKLLDTFTIARGRKHIAKYYAGQGGDRFPTRLKPVSLHPGIDRAGQLPPISELNDRIAMLHFPQYQLLSFVAPNKLGKYAEAFGDTWGTNINAQVNRSQAIAGLMRVNLLKRLESSVHSFRLSLQRITQGARELFRDLDSVDAGLAGPVVDMPCSVDAFGDDDDDLDQVDGRKVDLRDVDRLKLRGELEADIEILDGLLSLVAPITPERDCKLNRLADLLADKIERTPYNQGNRKVLVFSAFADTARYLYEQLAVGLKEDYGIDSALVTGSGGSSGGSKSTLRLSRTTFDNVLAHFSPRSKELSANDPVQEQIDVVFATDCISEGQNLQDCDCLVNYDIHWNPVRIIQRFGRIDRLGSTNERIQLVNFWPDLDLDEYIQLEGRVRNRMIALDASASGDENVLEGKRTDEMNDLLYRRQQLKQLQQDVLDLEDIQGNISITDFALDDFRVELQRYAQTHGSRLEDSPMGLHAVARIPENLRDEIEPGVIFCLKRNDRTPGKATTNPIAPYCVAMVDRKGQVKTTLAHPKAALDCMRGVCAGQDEPIRDLFERFNKDTKDGTDMHEYTRLLEAVVRHINGTAERNGIDDLFSLGEVSAKGAAVGFDDYTLVTFVVMR